MFSVNFIRRFSTNVVKTDKLYVKDVHDVFLGKTVAIRVPNFCPNITTEQVSNRLKKTEIEEYINAEGIGKIKGFGMAYFEAENDILREKYFNQALPSIQTVRKIFSPYLSPVDKIRLILNEQWAKGTTLLNLGEGAMFVGLLRSITNGALPHEDKLERDDPIGVLNVKNIAQVAFNCYISVPREGGDLQLWDITMDTEKYNRLRGSNYGINPCLLPPPNLTLKPEIGELIIFNPRYLHAVKGNPDEMRISISGFILYQGDDKPLCFWS